MVEVADSVDLVVGCGDFGRLRLMDELRRGAGQGVSRNRKFECSGYFGAQRVLVIYSGNSQEGFGELPGGREK